MANPANSLVQNLLPVQAYFSVDGVFQTFIGQGQPFYASVDPSQSGLNITNSTINSTTIGATTPSTGVFTNIATTTGTITTQPSGANDIVNYLALQSYAVGISWKAPVTAATTANITLSGPQTIDGKAVVAGNTVLVKNQTNSAENGIYQVNAGAWTYATGCTTWQQYVSALVFVEYGGQQGSAWYCTAQPGGTLGTTAMTWSNFSAAANYTAGTGLTLSGFQFSITPVGTAGTYGSASAVPVFVTNASGQITSVTNTNIAISGSQIISGTIGSSYISGSYTGITGVGTLTAGTWNASTIGVSYGGTGATTLTGYVKGSGTTALTASSTIPSSDISGLGTMATQNANSVAITGGSAALTSLTTSSLTGYLYGNAGSAVTASTTIPTSALSGNFVSTFSAGTTGLTPNSNTSGAVTLAGTLAVANGGTGVTSSSGANSVVLRDANGNITTNCLFEGYVTQAASGTTITLTASSAQNYQITGSGGQVIKLPSGTTLPNGALFTFNNNQSSGAITVQNNSATTVATIQSGGYVTIVLLDNSTAAGSWDRHDSTPSNVSWSTNTLDYAGSITSATWNGTTIAINRGGTNGTATPTAGGVAYGSGTAYAFTAAGTSGQVLTSAGAGTPTWQTLAYATITDDTTTNATRYPLFASATSGNLTTEYTSSTKLQFNPSTGVMTVTGLASPAITNQLATTIRETATVSATAATGTINYDTLTQVVLYYTTNASGNFTVNFRGNSGTSLDSVMSTGQSLSATFLVTNGSTAYYNSAVTIDGNSVTPKWQGGSAPTSGNASSVDSYTYVIVKTGSATFTVLASQTKFA